MRISRIARRAGFALSHPSMGARPYNWLFLSTASLGRGHWDAKTKAEKEHLSQHITAIFEREPPPPDPVIPQGSFWSGLPPIEPKDPDHPRLRPAIVVNFESGQVTVKPRTLLDWLAKSLLDYREKLAICERDGCEHPYFVKPHARQRFCSPDCANSVRQQKKEQWWMENRDRFLKKWRQERKSARRRKRA